MLMRRKDSIGEANKLLYMFVNTKQEAFGVKAARKLIPALATALAGATAPYGDVEEHLGMSNCAMKNEHLMLSLKVKEFFQKKTTTGVRDGWSKVVLGKGTVYARIV